jgi:hypothetical protein
MSSPLVESFIIFQQYNSSSRLFPSEFRFVFVKLRLIDIVTSFCGFKSIVYMWMLAKNLMCTNLFKGGEGGFPLWHQMGLGKMNHTFEKTQKRQYQQTLQTHLSKSGWKCLEILLQDPSNPLLKKWVKVPRNLITRHPVEIVSNITFRDLTVVWQKDDGS